MPLLSFKELKVQCNKCKAADDPVLKTEALTIDQTAESRIKTGRVVSKHGLGGGERTLSMLAG